VLGVGVGVGASEGSHKSHWGAVKAVVIEGTAVNAMRKQSAAFQSGRRRRSSLMAREVQMLGALIEVGME
jgi:hypothetical protein